MTDGAKAKSWINYSTGRTVTDLRLFCFPSAGGSAAVYAEWPRLLPMSVEVCAVQYPGRGTRLREPSLTRVGAIASGIAEDVSSFADKPYAFFGHSMGAQVAFEAARLLERDYATGPSLLIVSACNAPRERATFPLTYDLPDDEFVSELRRMEGTPAEVLENRELMRLMLPILRADFAASQTYAYTHGPPLSCPIIAFGGEQDELVTREGLEAWGDCTESYSSSQLIPGDHFFVHTSAAALLRAVNQELQMVRGPGD